MEGSFDASERIADNSNGVIGRTGDVASGLLYQKMKKPSGIYRRTASPLSAGL
jgi:hypothetical protein